MYTGTVREENHSKQALEGNGHCTQVLTDWDINELVFESCSCYQRGDHEIQVSSERGSLSINMLWEKLLHTFVVWKEGSLPTGAARDEDNFIEEDHRKQGEMCGQKGRLVYKCFQRSKQHAGAMRQKGKYTKVIQEREGRCTWKPEKEVRAQVSERKGHCT